MIPPARGLISALCCLLLVACVSVRTSDRVQVNVYGDVSVAIPATPAAGEP